MQKIVVVIFVNLVTWTVIYGQDPIYSQFYNAPLQLNPAFCGNTHAPKITLNYRNQWPFVQQSFRTYSTFSASYDQFFKRWNSGVGVLFTGDDAGNGLIKTNRASLIYAYRLRVDKKNFIKGGLELGWLSTRYDWDQYIFLDQIDPESGGISPGGSPIPSEEIRPDNLTSNNIDISFGMLWYNPLFYAGLTLKHINQPNHNILNIHDVTYDGLPLRWSIHGGIEIPMSNIFGTNSFISPNILYVGQGSFSQINAGAYYGFSMFFAGLWYRYAHSNPDAVIFSAGLKKEYLKIGYSFDYTISKLGIANGGSHEIGILINLDSLVEPETDYSDCFQMFR